MHVLEPLVLGTTLLVATSVSAQEDRPPASFAMVDTNNDGEIDEAEFDRARRNYTIEMDFSKIDTDGNGKITQNEAMLAYETKQIDRSVADVMNAVDTDGNGTISRSEFRNSEVGKRNPNTYGLIDTNSDGSLSKEEIRRAVIQRRGGTSSVKSPEPGTRTQPDLIAPRETPLPKGMPRSLLRNQTYDKLPGVDPRLLSLDLYEAEGDGPHPILVMVHGGGWMRGDKTGRGVIAPKAKWFSENGFLFASVNYRLSPAIAHPEHANDVAQAIAWLAEHADEFGGDPDRIFLMGHSAGAHIVAAVGTDPRHLERAGVSPALVKGTIPLDVGAYDLSSRMPLSPTTQRMYEAAFGTPTAEGPNPWVEASPITYTKAPDAGERIAPFLLVTSSQRQRRTAHENTQAFAQALNDAGVEAAVVVVDKNHGQCSSDVGVPNDPLTIAIDEFLQRRLETLERVQSGETPG